MTVFTESEIEIFSLSELKQPGFSYIPGPAIAPDVVAAGQKMVRTGLIRNSGSDKKPVWNKN